MLEITPHPLLDLGAFLTVFPLPLAQIPSPPWLLGWLRLDGPELPPMAADDRVREEVRDLLRQRGYRPTGRGKPAAEYLFKNAAEGKLGSINAAVDACNAISLHSGLSISVVDLDLVKLPLRVATAVAGESYVFNSAGQVIELRGLQCLYDQDGPCANAVKDAQRTKTSGTTRRTISLVWGTRVLVGRTARTVAWYRDMLAELGATTQDVG